MALPVSRLHGAQHGAAYYFSLKYRYVYLRSVRIKRTGVVHAKVGQIVTFFAFCPPTGYGWLRGEEDPWSDALGASYALDQSARPLSGGREARQRHKHLAFGRGTSGSKKAPRRPSPSPSAQAALESRTIHQAKYRRVIGFYLAHKTNTRRLKSLLSSDRGV